MIEEIIRNIRLLHGQWIRKQQSSCTNLALYSLDGPEILKNWQCWSTKVFNIRVYATPPSLARFYQIKNCWNASSFAMDIAASYCWVWAGGHYRIFSNVWWGIRHHCRTVREGLYDFMWVLFGVRAPSILRPYGTAGSNIKSYYCSCWSEKFQNLGSAPKKVIFSA